MSQEHGDPMNRIAAIKELLLTGKLTAAGLEQRLAEIIDMEMCKPVNEIDTNFVSSCEDLLWNLRSRQTKHISSMKEETFHGLEAKRIKSQPSLRLRKQTVRTACVVSALLILVFVGNMIVGNQKLTAGSTMDEQKYEIQGAVSTPIAAEQANAVEQETVPEMISATNFDEIIRFLGYTPTLPTWIPAGWNVLDYIGFKFEDYDQFVADFSMKEEEYLLQFELLKYSDAAFAQQAFEQNDTGETIKLSSGKEIYITENYDKNVAIWIDGLECYKISGPISKEDLLGMVNSMKQ